ncbi:hotdog fold thioesterase [Candidatus Vondammii sp. HM_W22]|uniref:hotdog fold thioesterase n=1 Tax=Candidatus Vondammii sp. HM_W22 TaxID=2687299 RepID=UPI001F137A6C|nr:hotdog fold thioesterase [Candidatus Vondammii sp. HM_W22]
MLEQEQTQAIGRWMEAEDRFVRLLGIELEEVSPGYSRASLQVTGDMLNSVGITHGGVTFSLADFTFAVASNSHGTVSVALSAQISFPTASREGDRLTAEAREENRTGRTGLYTIEVHTGDNKLAGLFTGTVFRRSDKMSDWMNDSERKR